MSRARNIENDRGLTARMFLTGLFLVVLYGAFIAVLWKIGLSFGLIVVIAVAFLFAQYWFADKIALWGMHGRIVTPRRRPSSTAPSTGSAPSPTCPSRASPSRTPTCRTPSPPAGARRPPWCAPPPACCAGSTSPRSRPCSPTSSPTSPTETSRS